MKKYNYQYNRDGKYINIGVDEELDDHLKRHISIMMSNNKTSDYIMKWLHNRGISNEIDINEICLACKDKLGVYKKHTCGLIDLQNMFPRKE